MGLYLGLDTSNYTTSAALYDSGGDRVFSEKKPLPVKAGALGLRQSDAVFHHTVQLPEVVERLMAAAGISLNEVDAFAVDVGPGSFTGLRIGVCAVNALAFAANKPVIAVDALRALAEPYWDGAEPILSLVDAGHAASYAALYQTGRCVIPPCKRETEELLAAQTPETRVISGVAPRAADVALAAWRLRDTVCEAAAPLYIQPSQAERLYEERMGGAAHG